MTKTRQQLQLRCIKFITIDAKDSDTYAITGAALEQAAAVAVEARRQAGKMLVQCWGGCNRAPAIAVGLLMCIDRMDVVTACQRVTQVRGTVLTNHSFRLQLVRAAASMGLLPDVGIRAGPSASDPAKGAWDTNVPEELLELLWASQARGTGLEQADAAGKPFGVYLLEAVAEKDWPRHQRLMRRLAMMRGLLGAGSA